MSSDGLVWRSLPDSRNVNVFFRSRGEPAMRWPNLAVMPPAVMTALGADADHFWHDGTTDISCFSDRWVVNTLADLDDYAEALGTLDDVLGASSRIWNHPRAIALTRRDLAPQVFGDIPGLQVPHVVRIRATHPGIFRETFAREGFSYPVLVRPVSSQTGVGLVRIRSAADWAQVEGFSSLGRIYFMTQFVDYRDSRGRYAKVRLCFVDDTMSLREYGVSGGWQIGSGGSTSPSGNDAVTRAIDLLLSMAGSFDRWEALQRIGREMMERCPLNFWGVDLGVRDTDDFVLFEANAAMTMAMPSNVSGRNLERLQPIYDDIAQRLRLSFSRLRDGWHLPLPTLSVRDLLALHP